MHDFMHSPHLTHLLKNSSSGIAPGGLTIFVCALAVFVFAMKLKANPAPIEFMADLLERFMLDSLPVNDEPENLNSTAFWGQAVTQSSHSIHSL